MREKPHSGLPRLLSASEYRKGGQVSRRALIKMLIICGAMLTIQLLAYFAYQPIGSASYGLTTYTGAAIAH
jgi:hypothetical protein